MTIEKTYTIDKLVENAVSLVTGIYADNIDKTPTFDATFNNGYRWGATTSEYKDKQITTVNPSRKGTINGYLYTEDTIPSTLKKAVSQTKVEEQFRQLLNNRGLSTKKLQGTVVSVRTVQQIVDTVCHFIVARYQLWLNAGGTKKIVLYDSGSVSYAGSDYHYSVVDPVDTVLKTTTSTTQDALEKLMASVASAALTSLKVKRQGFQNAYISHNGTVSSSCSSSCSSSSSSSSSCSSSCSSSTYFLAYMKLS